MNLEKASGDSWSARRRKLLVGLIVLGGAMRLVGLGQKSLWVDEIHSVYVSETIERLIGYCRGGHTPPLRYLAIWALEKAPRPDLAIRLPAAVFGTLTIALMLWVGEMIWGRRAGLIAAALLLLSPWHLLHSQDARYYAVMLFLAMAALGLAIQVGRQPRPLWRWVVLSVVCALNLYISYTAIFSVAPVAIYLIGHLVFRAVKAHRLGDGVEHTKALARGMAVGGLVGLLVLAPWLPVMLGLFERYDPDASAGQSRGDMKASQVRRVLGWQTRYDLSYADDYLRKLGLEQPVVKWALLAFFALGVALVARRDPSFGFLAALWFIFPWVVILSTGIRYFAPPRYLIHYLGLYLLMAAVGVAATWECLAGLVERAAPGRPPAKAMRMALSLAGGAAALFALLAYVREDVRYFRTEKQDWRSVVAFLEETVAPSEVVLTGGFWTDLGLRYYGSQMTKPIQLIRHCVTARQIESQIAIHPSLWYVTWGPMLPETADLLERRFEQVRRFRGLQGDVLVFRTVAKGVKGDGRTD